MWKLQTSVRLGWDQTMALHMLILCCSCSLLLPDAAAQTIIYPFTSTCAVEGSTLTLPCTFSPLTSVTQGRKTIYMKIVRLVWCKNHEICHRETLSVYDSTLNRTTRYRYLGDMERNCTLQIRNVHGLNDRGTFRFRMEANQTQGHFTNRTGVRVKVPGWVQMEISRSDNHTEVRGGGTVTLRCTSNCTTHQLKVTWFRDGHALSESGPALQLGPLSAEDSGNYTCELKARKNTKSQPYSLKVEGLEGGNLLLIAAVTSGVLLAGITLILILVFIRRLENCLNRPQPAGTVLRTQSRPQTFQHLEKPPTPVWKSLTSIWINFEKSCICLENISYKSESSLNEL